MTISTDNFSVIIRKMIASQVVCDVQLPFYVRILTYLFIRCNVWTLIYILYFYKLNYEFTTKIFQK